MRVLIPFPDLAVTGAGLCTVEQAQYLRNADAAVTALVPPEDDGPLRQRLTDQGIAVVNTARPSDFHIALVPTVKNAQMVLDLAKTIPVVWHIHEAEAGLLPLMRHPDHLRAFAAATHVIYPSPHSAEIFSPYQQPALRHRSSVIPPGVAIPDGLSAGQPTDKSPTDVLFVGILNPLKHVDDLITSLLDHGPAEATLRIAGDVKALKETTRRQISENARRISLLGVLEETALHREYARAAILSLPSVSESFARAPLEAGLHGCVPILADLPVYRGLWQSGLNCLTHPPRHVRSLGQGITTLLRDPVYRQQLAEQARHVARHYRRETALARIHLVLQDVLAVRNSGTMPS